MMEDEVTRYSIGEHQTPAIAVVSAVENVTGTDPEDLTPIYHTLEPDALNALIDSGADEVKVEFEHEGCKIEVRSDETVVVEPQDKA